VAIPPQALHVLHEIDRGNLTLYGGRLEEYQVPFFARHMAGEGG
jgi:hypothetical protein